MKLLGRINPAPLRQRDIELLRLACDALSCSGHAVVWLDGVAVADIDAAIEDTWARVQALSAGEVRA